MTDITAEDTAMPLNIMDHGVNYTIQKILGKEKARHHLESLGFVPGSSVQILSRFNSYFVVYVKGTKIGIDEAYAKMIIVSC